MKLLKQLQTPLFWVAFGMLGFPFLCLSAALLMDGLLALMKPSMLNQLNGHPWHVMGLPFAIPLTVLSAYCASEWQSGRIARARWIAMLGGGTLSLAQLFLEFPMDVVTFFGDFAFIVPPLAWSGCLALFGLATRVAEQG